MPRLKNRNSQIPNGLSFLEPATGWRPQPWSSFDSIVSQVTAHRRGNAHVTLRHHLSTDQRTIEAEVDNWNAKVCLKMGWLDYIQPEASSFPKTMPPSRLPASLSVAGAHVKKAVAGVKIYTDWLGEGLKAVDRTLSEKRAAICAGCKENDPNPNWIQRLEAAAASHFNTLVEIKNDLELKTSHDDKLRSCQICDCPLKTKVHVPLPHILSQTSEKTMKALRAVSPACWITTEAKV